MGFSSDSESQSPTQNLKMKFLVALCLVASAMALEDTADVAAAKADFNAAFMAAEAGEHAALAPAPVASYYLADDAAVAEAKAAFAAAFAAAEKGEHAALAPKPVEALPVPELTHTTTDMLDTHTTTDTLDTHTTTDMLATHTCIPFRQLPQPRLMSN